jgi:hypothetical protein
MMRRFDLGGVDLLGLELVDAVKEEFGEQMSVVIILKSDLEGESDSAEYVKCCLATIQPLYNHD